MLYFVKGNTIGSEFGFPRLGIKKKYKWYRNQIHNLTYSISIYCILIIYNKTRL